uniref:Uncharacterized protein n=1 Tax=Tanacetum cinerariifolium TaxID=118510 RepID=A0A6L2KPB1_TANCI|nr:hypothetical protein [Tanacetum cinerariifolium]
MQALQKQRAIAYMGVDKLCMTHKPVESSKGFFLSAIVTPSLYLVTPSLRLVTPSLRLVTPSLYDSDDVIRDGNKTRTRQRPDPQTRIDWGIIELTGRKILESPWGSPILNGDGDGDEKQSSDVDGDGDVDESKKRGWDGNVDDEVKPPKKVDYPVNSDSDDERG